jgi:Enoyl-(Acyl carrier protein) reductase
LLYAREGANVSIVYLPVEQSDAEETRNAVEGAGGRCLLLPGDLMSPVFCDEVVKRTVDEYGQLDILVRADTGADGRVFVARRHVGATTYRKGGYGRRNRDRCSNDFMSSPPV